MAVSPSSVTSWSSAVMRSSSVGTSSVSLGVTTAKPTLLSKETTFDVCEAF